MYCEDVDLNLRARLAGIRTLFVPSAVVYHRLSATGGGTLASYYCGRNFIAVWAKNMPTSLVLRYFVSFIAYQLMVAFDAARHSSGVAARARLRGQLAGLRALPRFLAKRRERRQSVTNQEFARWLGR
jgi:GT2 family glycosyltransferase